MPFRVIIISKPAPGQPGLYQSCFTPMGDEFRRKYEARDFIKDLSDEEYEGYEFTIIKTYPIEVIHFEEPD